MYAGIIFGVAIEFIIITLIDNKMNRPRLINISGNSYNVSGKLACNELVSLESLFKFCMALKQNIWDIVVLKNKNKNEFKGDFL
ncbi:hypothetical protein [Flavonifractor sp. An52]|uniref:hypothetical protein n=1 Tax=Flavonifractor sp. An52 TaxID=1965642 RepID=UPI001FA8A205|nr:hypothetical protein [Flavonifractor sp. An52]